MPTKTHPPTPKIKTKAKAMAKNKTNVKGVTLRSIVRRIAELFLLCSYENMDDPRVALARKTFGIVNSLLLDLYSTKLELEPAKAEAEITGHGEEKVKNEINNANDGDAHTCGCTCGRNIQEGTEVLYDLKRDFPDFLEGVLAKVRNWAATRKTDHGLSAEQLRALLPSHEEVYAVRILRRSNTHHPEIFKAVDGTDAFFLVNHAHLVITDKLEPMEVARITNMSFVGPQKRQLATLKALLRMLQVYEPMGFCAIETVKIEIQNTIRTNRQLRKVTEAALIESVESLMKAVGRGNGHGREVGNKQEKKDEEEDGKEDTRVENGNDEESNAKACGAKSNKAKEA